MCCVSNFLIHDSMTNAIGLHRPIVCILDKNHKVKHFFAII
jgi:hypothetical protein